jgi:hypothetical protein
VKGKFLVFSSTVISQEGALLKTVGANYTLKTRLGTVVIMLGALVDEVMSNAD